MKTKCHECEKREGKVSIEEILVAYKIDKISLHEAGLLLSKLIKL